MNGIDYSDWRPSSAAWVKQNGFGFVCRYLDYTPNPKVIGPAEFSGLHAAGVEVVLNWEDTAERLNSGASAGTADAQAAMAQAKALGAWPCPIYFSADWDVTPAQQANVNAYLSAAAKVLGGVQYVGLYGGYYVITRAAAAGVASWFWQTFAWSGDQANQLSLLYQEICVNPVNSDKQNAGDLVVKVDGEIQTLAQTVAALSATVAAIQTAVEGLTGGMTLVPNGSISLTVTKPAAS